MKDTDAKLPLADLRTGPAYEPIEVSVTFVVVGAIGLFVLIAGTLLSMVGLMRLLSPETKAESMNTLQEAPARTVGLEPNQVHEREELIAEQRQWLSEYAWLEEDRQRARIPIERAIQIIQERGLDAEPAPDANAAPPGRPSGPVETNGDGR